MALDQVDVDRLEKAEKELTFFEHLELLRWHLIRSVCYVIALAIIIFLFKDFVFGQIILGPNNSNFLTYQAFCKLSNSLGLGERLCFVPSGVQIQVTEMGEAFITHIKVSIVLGLVLAFPLVFWEVWSFIKPGLLEKERKYANGIVFICSFLFSLGVIFGYFVLSPFAFNFLANYQIAGVDVQAPRLASVVSYMTMFTVPIGFIFQLPVVVYFFTKIGLLTPAIMKQYRRHAVILILALAAMITPPDIITQFLVGIPLFILYEISINISARVLKKEKENELIKIEP